jgi:uncharacterized protein
MGDEGMIASIFNKLLETPEYVQLLIDQNTNDWSHNYHHFIRVAKIACKIAESEACDKEVLIASSLLIDITRHQESKINKIGNTKCCHAEMSAIVANTILPRIGFPEEKISRVRDCILVHRKSKHRKPETIEQKIIQDANYLDLLGVTAVVRTVASSLQPGQHQNEIYDAHTNYLTLYEDGIAESETNKTALHYMIYLTQHERLQPNSFLTKIGREMAIIGMKTFRETIHNLILEFNLEM